MKNFIIIIAIISISACKAQSPIVSIDAFGKDTPDGAYFKDLDNEFNKFEGTWIFTNGNNSFTLQLEKIEMAFDGTDYEDKLIGEYKYIENGIEIVNTLTNITNPNKARHHIKGKRIIKKDIYVICEECSDNERRVKLNFYDSERNYLSNSIILRYLVGSSPEKITATLISDDSVILPSEDAPTSPRVPYGEYTMTKQ